VFVAFDTTVYINSGKLEELDIAGLLGLTPGGPIRLLVPMAVVDELDNLKQSSKAHARWRAGYTTAVLYRVLRDDPAKPAPLHPGDLALTIELLPDPPGHVRLPITDDEIIDRVASAQALAGRQVTLVTYDTGQALRAHLAGLDALRLPSSIEEQSESPK
jgi:predicted ribonuclease YlaK